jgi:hypothetical protein
MPTEERDRINKQIEEYDLRPPFDADQCRVEFNKRQAILESDIANKLPDEIYMQIADPRVFALGYCTKEIRDQLKKYSKENEKKVRKISIECTKAQKEQDIPSTLRNKFTFHDCEVTKSEFRDDIIFWFNTSSGFSSNNKIIFHDAKVIKQELPVEGSVWLYEELYRNTSGYEAHMLFLGETIHEVTLCCRNITID